MKKGEEMKEPMRKDICSNLFKDREKERGYMLKTYSRSILVGVQGFESLPPHLFSLKRENVHEKRNSQN